MGSLTLTLAGRLRKPAPPSIGINDTALIMVSSRCTSPGAAVSYARKLTANDARSGGAQPDMDLLELRHLPAGYTATRNGLTHVQRTRLMGLLALLTPSEFHHGDCLGGDDEAHGICLGLQIPIYIHPPEKDDLRAFCHRYRNGEMVDMVYDPKPYLARNHDIVGKSSYLIACPKGPEELVGSGTWATVRYARTAGIPVFILYPDGLVDSPFEDW